MEPWPFNESTTYERAVRCSRCDKMIKAGELVYGTVRAGRYLSDRHCYNCDQKIVDRRVKLMKARHQEEALKRAGG